MLNHKYTLTALTVAGAIALSAGLAQAQEDQVAVGTYDPEQVFQQYDGRQQMMNQMRQAQQEAQQAQQNGDQEQARQAQQEIEQQREQLMDQFDQNLQEAAGEVAAEEGLTLLVNEITYASDQIETRDVTDQVTETLNELADVEEPETPDIQVPGQQQQEEQSRQQQQQQQQQQRPNQGDQQDRRQQR